MGVYFVSPNSKEGTDFFIELPLLEILPMEVKKIRLSWIKKNVIGTKPIYLIYNILYITINKYNQNSKKSTLHIAKNL